LSRNYLEEIAEKIGIKPDDLYSGKYGDSYDEILDNILKEAKA
jgi:hypothetical protein